jgi:mannose-1-phosphate guanylyltransferase
MSVNNESITPRRLGVVMAGGSGERFWPLSTASRPKQLLCLTDPQRTMIQEAVDRLLPVVGPDGVYVSTTVPLAEPIGSAGVVPKGHILAEPLRRNTLGALVWVVASLLASGEKHASVAIVTADHAIGDAVRFSETIQACLSAAESTGGLVTIGVTPVRPETGYGYIERDESDAVALPNERVAHAARSFREKPDEATARSYVESGRFLWNAGMFFFTIDGFRRSLAATQPAAAEILETVAQRLAEGDRTGAEKSFAELESISFDYAVMERAERVHVVESDFPWDDVGAWDALERTLGTNDGGNVVVGPAAVMDSKGCVVYNDAGHVAVGICGLEDVVVVVTDSGVLVCRKEDVQRVREIGRSAIAAISPSA